MKCMGLRYGRIFCGQYQLYV